MRVRSLFLISTILFCWSLAGQSFYHQVLELPQNPDNPGFVTFPEGLNSFYVNPAIVSVSNRPYDVSFSYLMHPAGLNEFTLNADAAIPDERQRIGFSAQVFYIPNIPLYTLDPVYFDARGGNTFFTPTWLVLESRFAPDLKVLFFKPGFGLKFVTENTGGQLSSLLFDAGGVVSLPGICELGFAMRNLGIPFFVPIQGLYLPLDFSAGIRRDFTVRKDFTMEPLISFRAVLNGPVEILGGLWNNIFFPGGMLSARVWVRVRYPDDWQNALGLGMSLKINVIPGLRVVYGVYDNLGDWYHSFSVVYGD